MTTSDPRGVYEAIAARGVADGDPTGWFEELYRRADGDGAFLPWHRGAPNEVLRDVMSTEGPGDGRRALVVGCGLGDDAEYLAGLGYRVTAFDVAQSAVASARDRFPDSAVDYLRADLLTPPGSWRGAFDLVFGAYTVQSLPPDLHAGAIRSVRDLLAPGGLLVVVATMRGDGPACDGPPWPLEPEELAAFAGGEIRQESAEPSAGSVVGPHRVRALFRRRGGVDTYQPTSEFYDLLAQPYRAAQEAALAAAARNWDTDRGPILDVGAGTGLNVEWILEHLPGARVLAVEPSPSMRAQLTSRVARRPEWHPRVTIRPESAADVPLPTALGGAVMLGVLGHLDAAERRALFADLGDRLGAGGAVLFDLQQPERPAPVEPFTFCDQTIGDLRYTGEASARPVGGDGMEWLMRYATLDGDRVLRSRSMLHLYHHPSRETVREEAAAGGLELRAVPGDPGYWSAVRPS